MCQDDDERDRDDLELAKMVREFIKLRNTNTASKALILFYYF